MLERSVPLQYILVRDTTQTRGLFSFCEQSTVTSRDSCWGKYLHVTYRPSHRR